MLFCNGHITSFVCKTLISRSPKYFSVGLKIPTSFYLVVILQFGNPLMGNLNFVFVLSECLIACLRITVSC